MVKLLVGFRPPIRHNRKMDSRFIIPGTLDDAKLSPPAETTKIIAANIIFRRLAKILPFQVC